MTGENERHHSYKQIKILAQTVSAGRYSGVIVYVISSVYGWRISLNPILDKFETVSVKYLNGKII